MIVPATEAHALALSRALRPADAREIVAMGAEPAYTVMAAWRTSLFSSAALWDGEVAAVWGLCATDAPDKGCPWLLTAPVIERFPALRFARAYRSEAKAMLEYFPLLENFVDISYDAACRMIALAGFRLDDPKPYGPLGSLFRRFEMRAL